MEPSSGATPDHQLYKSRVAAARDGLVSPARHELALPRISAWCLLPLGYEDAEPPAGTDPASLALRRRRSAIELRGLELPIVESNHEPPGSEPDAAAS